VRGEERKRISESLERKSKEKRNLPRKGRANRARRFTRVKREHYTTASSRYSNPLTITATQLSKPVNPFTVPPQKFQRTSVRVPVLSHHPFASLILGLDSAYFHSSILSKSKHSPLFHSIPCIPSSTQPTASFPHAITKEQQHRKKGRIEH
jgi:hypothetical protein